MTAAELLGTALVCVALVVCCLAVTILAARWITPDPIATPDPLDGLQINPPVLGRRAKVIRAVCLPSVGVGFESHDSVFLFEARDAGIVVADKRLTLTHAEMTSEAQVVIEATVVLLCEDLAAAAGWRAGEWELVA